MSSPGLDSEDDCWRGGGGSDEWWPGGGGLEGRRGGGLAEAGDQDQEDVDDWW